MFLQQPEADRLVQAAVVELAAGRVGQASILLDQAIRIDPCHPMALTGQAELALVRKNAARALELTEAALRIEPNFAPAWHQRASALWGTGRQAEAVAAARRAVDIQPPNPEFRMRLAQFTAWTGNDSEARYVLRPLLDAGQRDPARYATATAMLGELAIADGRFDDALPFLDQALDALPELRTARMLRGMNLLRLGRFAEGWADYAAREGITGLYPEPVEKRADQIWRGQDLAGRTLLVIDDQGHGDAIQFFRYLPMLRDRGADLVTWRTFQPLVRLLAASAPYARVVAAIPDDAWFDFQCNSTSLPRLFETTLETVPVGTPYLRPPSRLKSAMQRPTGRGLKVGLVWSGDARHARDHLRSIPAATFLSLAELPGAHFHSLQHEVRAADRPALEAHPALGREVEKAADFADTAALIAGLDLVIAVDTGIAHLAGALGKPVWLILHVAADWRWLADREDSPWYPSIRLFRVSREERRSGAGWGPVVDRVRTALRAFTAR
jgi:tetratricopeptide (TPR) repeat protein